MTWADFKEMAGAIGYPAALILAMGWLLWNNGKLKVVFRGDRSEELAAMKSDITDLEAESVRLSSLGNRLEKGLKELAEAQRALDDRTHAIEKDVAVLNDRGKRGE